MSWKSIPANILGLGPHCLAALLRWFYDLGRNTIFSTLVGMHQPGQGVDIITLMPRLKDTGSLDEVGGLPYLSELERAATSPENLDYYLPDLRSAFHRRASEDVGARLIASARDKSINASDLLEDAENALKTAREIVGGCSLPKIADAAGMMAEPIDSPPELIQGLSHRGSKLVLGGGSKTFETWTLLHLAISVSNGEPWLSFQTTKGRVLYLNLEIQPWAFQQRVKEIARAKSLRIVPGRLDCWNLRGHATDFSTLLPQIRDRIKADGHSLIILDPIYKLYGKGVDENAAGDVAQLLNAIEDLAMSAGAAVAFCAHFSKGNQAGKESLDRISGRGVFARDPDSILVMTRHEEADAFTVESTLRNFKPIEPFAVRWKFPLMLRDDSLDPARLKQISGRPQKHRPESRLEISDAVNFSQ